MDLHGLRVREAKELMQSMIIFYRTQFDRQLQNQINNAANNNSNHGLNNNNSSSMSPNKRHIVMRLIVGRGLHSIENKAVLGNTHPLIHTILRNAMNTLYHYTLLPHIKYIL